MSATNRNIICISQLRPTQITVGMLEVRHKRVRLRALEKRPAELLDFILEHPIRVVLGPKEKVYVVDHHHLALALLKEKFETAPMDVEDDLSSFGTMAAFWKKMQALHFVHPYDADGHPEALACIPKGLAQLIDDPYRSLVGFVRGAGGFKKVQAPYAEFLWADYYRSRIEKKLVSKHFNKAFKNAMALAHDPSANKLPGFLKSPAK